VEKESWCCGGPAEQAKHLQIYGHGTQLDHMFQLTLTRRSDIEYSKRAMAIRYWELHTLQGLKIKAKRWTVGWPDRKVNGNVLSYKVIYFN
jgi:hypothetical protein